MTVTCNDPVHEAERRGWHARPEGDCPNCGIGPIYHECWLCAGFGAHGGKCHHHRFGPCCRDVVTDEACGTPCLICGAPINGAGEGHEPGCMGLDG